MLGEQVIQVIQYRNEKGTQRIRYAPFAVYAAATMAQLQWG
jgi:hypothetical protein